LQGQEASQELPSFGPPSVKPKKEPNLIDKFKHRFAERDEEKRMQKAAFDKKNQLKLLLKKENAVQSKAFQQSMKVQT
jgi:hypothetical protein